ncbi:hypothetical protein ACFSQ7_29605 [Paenibacillus rhizoplanae]
MKDQRHVLRWLTNWGWILLYIVLMSGAVWFIMQEDREQIEDTSPEKNHTDLPAFLDQGA